jgi:hypothetical protein
MIYAIQLYFTWDTKMSEIPYTPLAGKIGGYFGKFQETGVPPKVNADWLKSLGYKSGNDSYIIAVLKFIGFIDNLNVPTDIWKSYKDPTRSSAILAKAIQTGYKDLFAVYEDAYRKDREALYAFFSSKTGKAKATVDLMVNTFLNLCQLADFEKTLADLSPKSQQTEEPSKTKVSIRPERGIISEMHINIQLHLPATNDSTVYDALFKSLRKHLLSDEE